MRALFGIGTMDNGAEHLAGGLEGEAAELSITERLGALDKDVPQRWRAPRLGRQHVARKGPCGGTGLDDDEGIGLAQ